VWGKEAQSRSESLRRVKTSNRKVSFWSGDHFLHNRPQAPPASSAPLPSPASRKYNKQLDGREILLSYLIFNMATPQVHHLFHAPIADHSFSTDKQTLAVARENNVELYQQSGNKFSLSDELKGHEKTVTSVDIAPNSGRIVTCSQGQT
jgi:WD40 repeat protein